MTTQQLTDAADNVKVREINGERAIDFDLDANSDYEIQSSLVVDDDNRVVEAAVRFGRVEEQPEIGVGKPILNGAWTRMAREVTGYERIDSTAIEADLSDFEHIVPHLRVERENVKEFGLETLSLDEFVTAVVELATLVERVFRGDTDNEIDDWL